MPETIIPIGDDGIAGQICLGIKGAEAGKVYYWDQQNEPLDEEDYLEDYGEPRPPEAMFQNVHLIAESFEDFLRRLEVKAD
jgi:SMI1 / KNR4 family (SUKH-1)